jgi:transposase
MPLEAGKKRVKTDKRDAEKIARCLAFRTYKPVAVPTEDTEMVKDFIRMRNDHKQALTKTRQQINAFCLRHKLHYTAGKHKWTQKHLEWLGKLSLDASLREILDGYLLTQNYLLERITQMDKRIEELSRTDKFNEKAKKLMCFIGIKTITAMTVLAEIGDFSRFKDAEHFSSYLGLTPGEDSSGSKQKRLGITHAGNNLLRRLLVESAHCYNRGQIGYKSKDLKARQSACSAEVVAYADRANIRLKKRYFRLLSTGKNPNVACVAIARELACFIWGMMVNKYNKIQKPAQP